MEVGNMANGKGPKVTPNQSLERTPQSVLPSAAFHQVRESFSEVSLALMPDPSLISVVNRAIANDPELTEDEVNRFQYFLLTFLRRRESAYSQSFDGTLEQASEFFTMISKQLDREDA